MKRKSEDVKRQTADPTGLTRDRAQPGVPALMIAAAVAALLGGCATDNSDLDAWMVETRQNSRVGVAKIPEPKRFIPFRYASYAPLRSSSIVSIAPYFFGGCSFAQ